MALFGNKKNQELSRWARLREDVDGGQTSGLTPILSAVQDRWRQGIEGRLAIVGLTMFLLSVLSVLVYWLSSWYIVT